LHLRLYNRVHEEQELHCQMTHHEVYGEEIDMCLKMQLSMTLSHQKQTWSILFHLKRATFYQLLFHWECQSC